jgi:hypothetical protein
MGDFFELFDEMQVGIVLLPCFLVLKVLGQVFEVLYSS